MRALNSGRLGYAASSITREFEEAFAAYHGARYAIALASGTAALAAAYHGCGYGDLDDRVLGSASKPKDRDELLVGSYGFFATASAMLWLGIRPRFCDVDPTTRAIDLGQLTEISPNVRGVALTYVAGDMPDMRRFCRVAREKKLTIIEDASHAHGARFGGRLAGTFGRAAAFSTQTGKLITGGEGGVVLTDDAEVFRRVAEFGNFRRLHGTNTSAKRTLIETGLGLKLRMGPLESALAHFHLDHINELIAARATRLGLLTRLLLEGGVRNFVTPRTSQKVERGAFYEYHLSVRIPNTLRVRGTMLKVGRLLRAEGVVIRESNTKAIHKLPLLKRFAESGNFPVAEHLEATTLSLPTFTTEPNSLVESYVDAIIKVDRALPEALAALLEAEK
jgi:perosamine synthetase